MTGWMASEGKETIDRGNGPNFGALVWRRIMTYTRIMTEDAEACLLDNAVCDFFDSSRPSLGLTSTTLAHLKCSTDRLNCPR